MGTNNVVGPGNAGESRKTEQSENKQDFKMIQLDKQKENVSKEIQKQLSKKDSTQIDKKAISDLEVLEQKVEQEKMRMEKEADMHKQLMQSEEDTKTTVLLVLQKEKLN